MESYADVDLGDDDFELAHELFSRLQPFTTSGPGWQYLTCTRGLPATAVNYCAADLRMLAPPIPGFDRLAYGIASLLRDGKGEVSGFAIEAVGPAGERIVDEKGRTARKSYRLCRHGVRDALFRVDSVGEAPMICFAIEGRLAKAVAVAALYESPAIVGFGARPCLGFSLPPEPSLVILEDRRPEGEDGERHERDMLRGADRAVLAGRLVSRVRGPCPGGCCKDLDQAYGRHPLDELLQWHANREPHELTLDGHARRCARISDPLRRGEAVAEVVKRFELKRQGLTGPFRAEVAKYADGDEDAEESEPEAKGTPLDVVDVLPWPQPVDGAAVLSQVADLLRAHVVMKPHEAHLVALWCLFTHALNRFWFNPRLAIRSPTKRCGKTSLLDIVASLVARPLAAANVTESAIFRVVEAARPSLLIDEADCFIGENPALRSVLNSGHTRTSAHVIRVVTTATGEQEPRKFSTWAPVAVALIGQLPGTLADRSIDIQLQRKPRSVRVRRLRKDRGEELPALCRKLARFAADHKKALEEADPEPPEALHDRMADNMRPIMAIAEIAGGDWPARAKAAALMLGDIDDDSEDMAIQLLGDIHGVFTKRKAKPDADKIWTEELLEELLNLRERPWPEANNGRGLTARGITQLLRPFGIAPQQVRKGATNRRGYSLSFFDGAFEQYLPATSLRSNGSATYSDFQNATSTDGVADENSPKPAETADHSTVADSEGVEAPLQENKGRGRPNGDGAHAGNGVDSDPSPAQPKRKRREVRGADTDPKVEGI